MKGPSMRSGVAATAMPRTRVADLEKKLSRSFAAGSLSNSNAPSSPRTMTGFGGPISRTTVFSAAMIHSGFAVISTSSRVARRCS